jgi:hypothetical protein
MPSLVALGAILMLAGGVLVLLQRNHTPRLRLSNVISADGIGDLAPLFAQIGRVDTGRSRLDQAIDTVIPVRTGQQGPPSRAAVVRAYAVAGDRLAGFSQTYLHQPPSEPLTRFAALSRCVDETLAREETPDAEERPAVDAREDLLRRLDYLGGAVRWDRRQLPAAAPAGGQLCAVVRELRRGVVGYLDALRPLLVPGRRRGPARSRKKRAVLAQRMFFAEKEVAAADGLLARGAPVEALRTLSGVRLPRVAGPTADAAFTTACRAAATGLEAEATARETALQELVGQCGDVLDRHVDALLTAVAADAEGRRLLHRSAERSGRAAPEQNGSAQPVPQQADAADERADAVPRR